MSHAPGAAPRPSTGPPQSTPAGTRFLVRCFSSPWRLGLLFGALWSLAAVLVALVGGSAVALIPLGSALSLGLSWLGATAMQQEQQQRKQAAAAAQGRQQQLQSERARLLAVVQQLAGGVIVIDAQGHVVLANEAAKGFFGILRPPVGQPLVESIRHPELLHTARQVRADGAPREVIIEVPDTQRGRRVLRVRASALQLGEEFWGLLDASDETESRLIEAMRREFIANVSHELKTPLAAIKGYAETVELAIADDREAALHFVSQIHEQCRRLERLIADMMTLARAQAGAQHLRPTLIELAPLIAESIATYAPIAAAKGITLEHAVEHSAGERAPIRLYADREATLTIANNLIGNAIRYTPDGGLVSVASRREGDFGVLRVRDSGIGIPLHEQNRVFERFYRAEKSRQTASNGTGLGLAIVKNLTQAQGGRVALQSRPNRGSTFEIYLPVAAPPPRA